MKISNNKSVIPDELMAAMLAGNAIIRAKICPPNKYMGIDSVMIEVHSALNADGVGIVSLFYSSCDYHNLRETSIQKTVFYKETDDKRSPIARCEEIISEWEGYNFDNSLSESAIFARENQVRIPLTNIQIIGHLHRFHNQLGQLTLSKPRGQFEYTILNQCYKRLGKYIFDLQLLWMKAIDQIGALQSATPPGTTG